MSAGFHRWANFLLLAAVFGFCAQRSLHACQICLPFPKESATDHLLEAEIVVLAREDSLLSSSPEAVAEHKVVDPNTKEVQEALEELEEQIL